MDSTVLTVRTGGVEVVRDLTPQCRDFVRGRGDGLLHLFVPHATAGVAVLELGAGSDDDLPAAPGDVLPAHGRPAARPRPRRPRGRRPARALPELRLRPARGAGRPAAGRRPLAPPARLPGPRPLA